MLNGLDGNRQQVFDQPDLFLQKRFRMSDAAEHAVEPSHGVNARANFLVSREEIFAGVLIAELRLVSHDRGELAFELLADVDDERGANIVVERSVDDLEGAMRSERCLRRRLANT